MPWFPTGDALHFLRPASLWVRPEQLLFFFYGDKSSIWLGLESFLTLLRSLRHFLGGKGHVVPCDRACVCVCAYEDCQE